MDALERLARAYKMDKTMLTAFKSKRLPEARPGCAVADSPPSRQHGRDRFLPAYWVRRWASKDGEPMVPCTDTQTDIPTALRHPGRFATDEVDPSEYGIDDVDYIILSKLCN